MDDQRQLLAGLLESSRDEFVTLAGGIDDAVWRQRPSEDCWSPAEVAEHVTVVEASCVKLLAGRLFREQATEATLTVTEGRDDALLRWLDSEEKRQAPDFVRPTGRWQTRSEVMEAFQEHRAANIASYRTAPEELRAYAFNHPILGPLDGYQWALFLAHHLRRHTRQLERIVTALSEGDSAG